MGTIARNRKAKIEALKTLLTKCEIMSLDYNFERQDCPPAAAWKNYEINRRARLTEEVPNSKYVIQIHSNLWYDLSPGKGEE